MNIAAIFDPATSTSDTFTVPQSSANGKMVVYNESNISLQFTFQNGNTAYVPAWTAMLFHGPFGNVNVTWEQQTILSGGGAAPLSQVVVETYSCNEPIPGTFPAALVRQTNIGNSVPVSTSANAIINDGSVTNTNIVEATVSGDSASAVKITNNGAESLGTTANPGSLTITASAGHTGISVGGGCQSHFDDAKIYTDGNGTLIITGACDVTGQVNGSTASFTGNVESLSLELSGGTNVPKISSDSSGNINIDVPAGTRIAQINGGGVDLTTASTYDITAGTMHAASAFKFSNSQTMSKISTFSGTGSGTYNHNLGGTPAIVLPITDVSGSQTMGYDTVTSTQVHITAGGSLAFKAFCWA